MSFRAAVRRAIKNLFSSWAIFPIFQDLLTMVVDSEIIDDAEFGCEFFRIGFCEYVSPLIFYPETFRIFPAFNTASPMRCSVSQFPLLRLRCYRDPSDFETGFFILNRFLLIFSSWLKR